MHLPSTSNQTVQKQAQNSHHALCRHELMTIAPVAPQHALQRSVHSPTCSQKHKPQHLDDFRWVAQLGAKFREQTSGCTNPPRCSHSPRQHSSHGVVLQSLCSKHVRVATWKRLSCKRSKLPVTPVSAQRSATEFARVHARASCDVASTEQPRMAAKASPPAKEENASASSTPLSICSLASKSSTSSQGPLLPKAHDSRGLRGWVGPAIIKLDRRKSNRTEGNQIGPKEIKSDRRKSIGPKEIKSDRRKSNRTEQKTGPNLTGSVCVPLWSCHLFMCSKPRIKSNLKSKSSHLRHVERRTRPSLF